MTSKTFTQEFYGRKLTLETVNTWELEEGDTVLNYGCIMICDAFEDEVTKYGRTPEHDSKGARWTTAHVIGHEEGSIPLGWMGKGVNWPTWRIQGNTRAMWQRVVENVPA